MADLLQLSEEMKSTLHEIYHDQVRDLYNAEKQQLGELAHMESVAHCDDLKSKISELRETTNTHMTRLREICDTHGIPAEGETCEAMKGLIKEARHHLEETKPGPVQDASIIASLNRFEHYEIAGYGTAKAFAKALDLSNDASLLDENLDEASKLDDELTKIATGGWFSDGINENAA